MKWLAYILFQYSHFISTSNIKFNVITLHSLLGLYIGGENKHVSENTHKLIEESELIIFEEIYTHNNIYLIKIHNFMKKYNNKKYICNGDINQLEPIDEFLSQKKR